LKRKADDLELVTDVQEKFNDIEDAQIDQNLWQIPND
jgi:hypothetical protein